MDENGIKNQQEPASSTVAEQYFASDGYKKVVQQQGFNHIGKAMIFQVGLSLLVPLIVTFVIAMFYVLLMRAANSMVTVEMITNKVLSAAWYFPLIIALTSLIANTIPYIICAKKVCVSSLFRFENKSLKTIGIVCVLCLGVNVLSGFVVAILDQLFGLIGVSMPTPSFAMGGSFIANFILALAVCIIAPITEEFIFRGVLLRFFSCKGEKFAIIMSSFLFALIHGNLPQGIGAFFIGIVFGIIALKTKSIVIPIIGHVFNNTFATIMSEYITAGGSDILVSLIQLAFVAGAIAICVVFLRKRNAQPKSPKVVHDGYKMAFSSWSIVLTIVIYVGLTLLTMSGLVAI